MSRLAARIARVVTVISVRAPRLWPLLRPVLRATFDRLAPIWDDRRSPDRLSGVEAGLALVSRAPRRILDLGTGTGDAALAAAWRWPTADVVGVDVAPAMIDEAQAKLPPELADRVRFELGDASRLPFADGSFDLVILANMLPFFDELARVCAREGHLVIAFSRGAATPIYVPPERIRAELGRRGFAEFAVIAVGHARGLVARKVAAA